MRGWEHWLICCPVRQQIVERMLERLVGQEVVVADFFGSNWGSGVGSTNAKERSREQSECRAKAQELIRSWLREGLLVQDMEKIGGQMKSVHTKPRR